MPAMPWLLYRYLLGEILRVFMLCAFVLVLVIAFGAAIKPLAGDDLIGPLQTAKYIMLAIVPMLQFALPFSAGFAATIVLHRMTTDNEILAAAVGGISYRRILFPVACLGMLLLLFMVLLTQWVIPRFWANMDRLIATDVVRMVQASIAKGMPVQFGNYQIYADRLLVQEDPPDSDAETRLVFFRLVAAELDRSRRIVADVAARQAVVDVYRQGGQTFLMLAAEDAVLFDGKSGQLAYTRRFQPDRAIPVPRAFQDDPMFMTQGQLLDLRRNPDSFSQVVDAKVALAKTLQQIETWKHIAARLARDGKVDLSGTWGGTNDRLVVYADGFVRGRFRTDDRRPVEIQQFDGDRAVRRIRAARAATRPAVGATPSRPTIDLVLGGCEVTDLGREPVVNQRGALTVPDLLPAGYTGRDLSTLPHEEMLARAAGLLPRPHRHAEWLSHVVMKLKLEIDSRLQRRYALSLTSLLLLLLGATLAMWLRNSLPLVTYIWAFLPSVLDILLISGGDHMIRHGLVFGGTAVMWSGNALLAVILLGVLARLMRN